MKFTIIPVDNAVYVDGYSYGELNLSTTNILKRIKKK